MGADMSLIMQLHGTSRCAATIYIEELRSAGEYPVEYIRMPFMCHGQDLAKLSIWEAGHQSIDRDY